MMGEKKKPNKKSNGDTRPSNPGNKETGERPRLKSKNENEKPQPTVGDLKSVLAKIADVSESTKQSQQNGRERTSGNEKKERSERPEKHNEAKLTPKAQSNDSAMSLKDALAQALAQANQKKSDGESANSAQEKQIRPAPKTDSVSKPQPESQLNAEREDFAAMVAEAETTFSKLETDTKPTEQDPLDPNTIKRMMRSPQGGRTPFDGS